MRSDNTPVGLTTPWAMRNGITSPSRWLSRFARAAIAHRFIFLLVILSLLRGAIYATVLPPWDLNDEEQHFDYVQFLSVEHELPLMGSAYLSSDILASASQTQRWAHFHLQPPKVVAAQQMGLEGYSYEAYQPPFYYAVLTLPYEVLKTIIHGGSDVGARNADVLAWLYGLRLFTVLLSTISVCLAYRFFRAVFAAKPELAVAAAVLLALIPERTLATSRVNNDGMLELLSTLTLLLVIPIDRSFTFKRSLVLGLVLGLAILTKISAAVLVPLVILVILWQAVRARSLRHLWLNAGTITAVVIVVAGWFFARNYWLYADVTGAASLINLAHFEPQYTFSSMIVELFRDLWMTRWEGAGPEIFDLVMAFVGILSFAGLMQAIATSRRKWHRGRDVAAIHAVFLFSAAVIWLLPLWSGVRMGVIQHIEGRFLAPSYVPIIALLLLGLSFLWDRRLCLAAAVLLVGIFTVADTLYLISFSLPYYYSLPAFAPFQFLALKPSFVNVLALEVSVPAYLIVLGILLLELVRPLLDPRHVLLTAPTST